MRINHSFSPFYFKHVISHFVSTTERKKSNKNSPSSRREHRGTMAGKHIHGGFRSPFMDSPKNKNSKNRDSTISAPPRQTMADSR